MSQARRPTLEDVAARAGVGRGTASRVINGASRVSAQAREAVQTAIDELGYVPNRAARSLVTNRTDAIALVIAESEERVFGEPFFAGVVRGIGTAVAEADKQLVLLLAPAERAGHIDDYLTRQHVDGVLLLSLHDDDTLPTRIRGHGIPVVLGGGPRPGPGVGYVDNDNAEGARLAVAHLLERGRSRIATIAGPADMTVGHHRLEGYLSGLREAGLEPLTVQYGDFSQASGEAAMRTLLEQHPDLDAVFAASDPMAAGAMTVLRETGRTVPEDVAVVGFDDSAVAVSLDLTSVHQSADAMGRAMVEMLTEAIRAPDDEPATRMLPTHLVVRSSS
ncbi:LacI family DNA-binding transcriptional regulator [Nocardioides sp. CER19]|uniref:LacI family DNA-binding transcriptional regulator n=1 Tax=Nocardioides sp. CER19 TaxID=3038538 RepID=UPI00244C4A32|nr:LacI family DNA-binding transcriptional regulator [Nocardioides sp. CER19]MDH2413435.1 LacI family DNA-binding transcriptional regulator [Nocardioides sp. CER19]